MINRLIESLERLKVPDGDLMGQSFTVLAHQRRFLRGAFGDGVQIACLSMGRGGGKTGLGSALAADFLLSDGVLHRRRGECVLLASSFSQAKISFDGVVAMLTDSGRLDEYRVLDHENMALIQNKETGARLRVAGSDSKRAHGWRFDYALCDEPSQWQSGGERLAAAVKTGLGKRRGARALFFGTRASNSLHFFARLLADTDSSIYSQVHAASKADKPFSVATLRKANPGLDHGLPHIETLRAEARRAAKDGGELATFKSLRLNMGVSEISENLFFDDPATWAAAEAQGLADPAGRYALGLDLSDGAALSAAAGYWPVSKRLECVAAFPSIPDLESRAQTDAVEGLYENMRTRGDLILTPGRAVDVGELLRESLRRWGAPTWIVADRYREKDLRAALDAAKFPQAILTTRGQGFKDGSEDVRLFRRAVLDDKVRPGPSLLLATALSEARLVSDPAGNEKLAKRGEGGRRTRARDDSLAAAILAVAEGIRRGGVVKRSWNYRGVAA